MTSRDMERVSHYVRARRGDLDMTQEELARVAGVDTKTIYNVESGTHLPYPKNASKIEAALHWKSGALDTIARGGEPVVLLGVIPGDGGQNGNEIPVPQSLRRAVRARHEAEHGKPANGGRRRA